MARRPRVFAPGLLYHVIVRGNQRAATYLTEADYQAYLDRLAKYCQKYGAVVWAYCLMLNHAHLLVESSGPPLAKFMQGLQQSYTQHFNRTHKKVGHVFQGRYKAIMCEKDRYLLALIRYIHLNPVRAKLVSRPEHYAYSGHQAYLTGTASTVVDPLPGLAVFGGSAAYRGFVEEAIGEGHDPQYYAVKDQQFLGTEGFVARMREQDPQELTTQPKRPLLSAVKTAAAALKVDPAMLKSRDRNWTVSQQRTLAAYVLVRRKGYRVGEVANQLGRDVSTMSTLLSRFAGRLQGSVPLQQSVERVARRVSG